MGCGFCFAPSKILQVNGPPVSCRFSCHSSTAGSCNAWASPSCMQEQCLRDSFTVRSHLTFRRVDHIWLVKAFSGLYLAWDNLFYLFRLVYCNLNLTWWVRFGREHSAERDKSMFLYVQPRRKCKLFFLQRLPSFSLSDLQSHSCGLKPSLNKCSMF